METEASKGLDNPLVVNKHRQAASIVNKALQQLTQLCQPGQDIATLCIQGDTFLQEGLTLVFSNARIQKGIAVPTSLSVNNICAYYSPLPQESTQLAPGDLVKIDMGVHIDGYIATSATSLVIGSPEQPIRGPQADVLLAAFHSMQAALRLIKPGNTNYMLTEIFQKISEAYGVNVIQGVLSHQIKQHVIDGNQTVISKQTFDQHVEEFEFQVNEAYVIDVFMSTGDGKPKQTELRSTVFQRALDVTYNLKLKASRHFFAELNRRFPTLLFTLRAFSDQRNARLGVAECLKHNLLYQFPVIADKPGDLVAQFKVTVLILESGTVVITPLIFDSTSCESDKQIEDVGIQQLLQVQMQTMAQQKTKKRKNKKKKKATEQRQMVLEVFQLIGACEDF